MKHYFKYDSGYINIDTQNLFLTNTGNWQETHELKEKSPATKAKNSRRIARMQGFVFVMLCIFSGFVLFMFKNRTISFTFIGLLSSGAYFLLKSFKSEFGRCYKIPLAKIESIEQYGKDGLKINFRNEANEPDFEIVDGIDPKGTEILSAIGLYNHCW